MKKWWKIERLCEGRSTKTAQPLLYFQHLWKWALPAGCVQNIQKTLIWWVSSCKNDMTICHSVKSNWNLLHLTHWMIVLSLVCTLAEGRSWYRSERDQWDSCIFITSPAVFRLVCVEFLFLFIWICTYLDKLITPNVAGVTVSKPQLLMDNMEKSHLCDCVILNNDDNKHWPKCEQIVSTSSFQRESIPRTGMLF